MKEKEEKRSWGIAELWRYVYEGFNDAKTKATQVLFQVQIKTKKTKIKKKTKS